MISPDERRKLTLSCIERSKIILTAKAALSSLRTTTFLVLRVKNHLDSEKYLKTVQSELEEVINHHELFIASSLKKLVGKRNIHIGMTFWFSEKNLLEGHVPLYQGTDAIVPTGILFLKDFENPLLPNNKVSCGEILPYGKVYHLLNKIGPVIDKATMINVLYKLNQSKKSSNG